MPSPIFHSVAAVATAFSSGKSRKPFPWALCALLVLASNSPDLDLIPAVFFGLPPMTYHHGFTHSFAFCLGVGFFLSLVPVPGTSWKYRLLLLLPVACSHPVFDLLNTNGSPECRLTYDCGQPLAWPFVVKKWNTLLPVFGDLRLTTGWLTWFTSQNMLILAREIGYAALLFTAVWLAGTGLRKYQTS